MLFGTAGVIKTFLPPTEVAAIGVNYATELPLPLLRFIGISELAGALGLILPALTLILPWLTPLAAAGLATIQVLAIGFHAVRDELATTLVANLVLLALSLFVVRGRWRRAPIATERN